MSVLNNILLKAEELNADVKCNGHSKFHGLSEDIDMEVAPSALETDLSNIFARSEKIWEKKACSNVPSELSLKIKSDNSKLASSSLNFSMTQLDGRSVMKGDESSYFDDEPGIAENDVARCIERSFERARLEIKQTFFNHQTLNQKNDDSFFKRAKEKTETLVDKPHSIKKFAELGPEEELFGNKIDMLLTRDCNASLIPALKEAVQNINSVESKEIWSKAFAISSRPPLKPTDKVREFRTSKNWYEYVVTSSLNYLQDQYTEHMEKTIESNLNKAKRGGIPGTLSLVEAYLNVCNRKSYQYEDGLFENSSHSNWMILFYCLRVGDVYAAGTVSGKFLNVNSSLTLISVITNLSKKPSVDTDVAINLRSEWRRIKNDCNDIYKKAVYGIFLCFDCHEVNNNIEDWLWARLFYCKLYPLDLLKSFRQLQLTICVECGEKYFSGSENSLLYYSVLILTGQLELAVNALFTASYKTHATHLAILLYQHRLLVVNENVSSEILCSDIHDPTVCLLNFPKIVLLYVKDFEMINVKYALNYGFFLHKFKMDLTQDGESNLFESFVSRLVYHYCEIDSILGRLNEKAERVPGFIDKFSQEINIFQIISRVAFDFNICGKPLLACKLYLLAQKPNEAISLICKQLASVSIDPKSEIAMKTNELALWMIETYKKGNSSVVEERISALKLLVDVYNLFHLFSAQQFDQVLKVLHEIKIVPLKSDDVQSYVNSFQMVPVEVLPLLPEICVLLMKSVVAIFTNESIDSPLISLLKDIAMAQTLYTATVPYRFPLSVNSILLQLQAKII